MKVILHKLFPYAPYLNEYIGFEDEQRNDESTLEAIERLRKLAEKSHRERYPHLYPNGNEAMIETFVPPTFQPTEKLTNEERKNQTIQSHIKTINECKTLNNLKIFSTLAENNPEIKEAYELKLQSLQK